MSLFSFVDCVPMEHWARGLPSFSARLAGDEDQLSQQDEAGPDSPDPEPDAPETFDPVIEDVSTMDTNRIFPFPRAGPSPVPMGTNRIFPFRAAPSPVPKKEKKVKKKKKVKTKEKDIQTDPVHPVPGDLTEQIHPLMQLGCAKCRHVRKGCLVCTRKFYVAVAKLISTEPFPEKSTSDDE